MKRCFRDPISEIYEAAILLDQAVNEHLEGNFQVANKLIAQADIKEIRNWTESIWGAKSKYINIIEAKNPLPRLKKEDCLENRMPSKKLKELIIERDGYNCVFCGIPVIKPDIRKKIQQVYHDVLLWGRKNIEQHAAFQAMWLQYDHLEPHSRGGTNELENLVITCAPCNFGRMENTIEEVQLINPFLRDRIKSKWDGLERFK